MIILPLNLLNHGGLFCNAVKWGAAHHQKHVAHYEKISTFQCPQGLSAEAITLATRVLNEVYSHRTFRQVIPGLSCDGATTFASTSEELRDKHFRLFTCTRRVLEEGAEAAILSL